jgi:hypothetical protein
MERAFRQAVANRAVEIASRPDRPPQDGPATGGQHRVGATTALTGPSVDNGKVLVGAASSAVAAIVPSTDMPARACTSASRVTGPFCPRAQRAPLCAPDSSPDAHAHVHRRRLVGGQGRVFRRQGSVGARVGPDDLLATTPLALVEPTVGRAPQIRLARQPDYHAGRIAFTYLGGPSFTVSENLAETTDPLSLVSLDARVVEAARTRSPGYLATGADLCAEGCRLPPRRRLPHQGRATT